MQQTLVNKLYQYIRENNPDLLLQLEEDGKVTEYLASKINAIDEMVNQLRGQPDYIIEEACMDILTQPIKYKYLKTLFF